MEREMEERNEVSGEKGCGKVAPWKSPKNGLFHLAWKSAKTADSHFPTTPTAAGDLLSRRTGEQKNLTPDIVEINLLQRKMVLTMGSTF